MCGSFLSCWPQRNFFSLLLSISSIYTTFFLSRLEFELPGLSASTFLHHFSAIAKKYSQRIHFKPSENNNNEKKCY